MRQTRLTRRRQAARNDQGKPLLLRTAWICGALAVAALLLSTGVEWIGRGSLQDALAWVTANKSIYYLNAAIVFLILILIYSATGSLFPSLALATALLSLVSLISFFKTKLIGEPFFPWDIVLNQEGMNIAPLVTGRTAFIRIAVIVLVVLALLALRFVLKRYSLPWKNRLVLFGLSVAGLMAFGLQSSWTTNLQYRAGVAQIVWNQQENYGNNGFMLAFTLNVKNSIITKPQGYGETVIAGIAEQISSKREALAVPAAARMTEAETPEKQPNVIFIMNEAFWDPTLLPNVTYSEDPIPTIHRLQKYYPSGKMLSPQFGGGTSNVEFEILTGFSTSFLPSGAVPYQQYISRPVPTLASFFESKGYKSLAVHSYEGWFWNRNNVYKWMGFEGFKSLANFTEPEYKGAFVADSEVSRSIIRELDQSEEPVFIYAITMQNHGPYNDDRYGETDIKIEGDLTDDAKQILNTYTQGARDADESLRMLIEHYEQSDELTMIIFYGDHLPMLGYDFDVYKQGGFIESGLSEDWSLSDLQKMRTVPLVTWANFKLKEEVPEVISASFLGAYVLDALGMEPPGQFAFNSGIYRSLPGLLRNLTIDAGQQLAQTVPEEHKAKVEEYRLLQYDMLFGQQYLASQIDADYLTRVALPAYNTMEAGAEGLQ
jgi:phosphoglycerol transferase MdoB-like AlkP superfamily enzyme